MANNLKLCVDYAMPCPYCGSTASETVATKDPLVMPGFEQLAVSLVRCAACDLFYSTPLPDRFDQVLHSFFENSWETEHRNDVMDAWIASAWQPEPLSIRAARRLKRLLVSAPSFGASRAGEALRLLLERKPRTLLDIGCSYGGFVRSARMAGIEAYGTDPHHELVRRLKAYGVDCISQGVFGATAGPLGRYDALSLLSVVDHFPAITPKFFRDCALLLNPGGRAIICDVDPQLPLVRQGTTLKSPISFSYLTTQFMARAAADAGLAYAHVRCQSEPMYVFHSLTKPR